VATRNVVGAMSGLPPSGKGTSPLFVGIDPASSVSAVASLDDDAVLRHAVLRASGRDMPRRLGSLRRQLIEFLGDAIDVGSYACVVEVPVTRFTNPTLLAAYGVMVECAGTVLKCPVLTLTPAELDDWAYRAGRPEGVTRKERSMRLAWAHGYDGDSQDIADAVVCCVVARLLVQDQERRQEVAA
jgi:hypothetical protein